MIKSYKQSSCKCHNSNVYRDLRIDFLAEIRGFFRQLTKNQAIWVKFLTSTIETKAVKVYVTLCYTAKLWYGVRG